MMQHKQRLKRAILERPHMSLRRFTIPPTTNHAMHPPMRFFDGVCEVVHGVAPERAFDVVVQAAALLFVRFVELRLAGYGVWGIGDGPAECRICVGPLCFLVSKVVWIVAREGGIYLVVKFRGREGVEIE